MNYGNQRDHKRLDRMTIKDVLMAYAKATVEASPDELPRAEHLKQLMNLAGSELEKKWLSFVDELDLSLPSRAQYFIEKHNTRPDFQYDDQMVLVYVDGPIHDFPDRAKRDTAQEASLRDAGYEVIRFRHTDDWYGIIEKFPFVFGLNKKG